ncbi:isorenieratene synthase [Nocardioides scoriae]|uniref:Isorenieratene synthase n=1 Tax=Nocardioides scoriae TaxID=642780 RepID=A0A1H1SGF0_9ACTN|nr:FAD-dependent oxidoreductase [Nocardioides scoriae]SDS47075.1 isorenieratene synthase [Nocardioides scoriae]
MSGSRDGWRPGRDRQAVWHPPQPGRSDDGGAHHVAVVGGGIAGLTAATALAERGVRVTLLERETRLGGRVSSWPVGVDGETTTMSRGFHAFFRQYYNLRSLLRRTDPALERLRAVEDYPLSLKGGPTDSFTGIARTPPLNIISFVLRSPTFRLRDLASVDVGAAMGLLDVDFPRTFTDHDGVSAADFLDRLRFPDQARHLALEVFARSFFADAREFSAGELVAMFHSYFLGSAEGLLFDVPVDDYETSLWGPLARRLAEQGVDVRTGTTAESVESGEDDRLTVLTDEGPTVVDGVVLATDRGPLQRLVASSPSLGDHPWRRSVAAGRSAPPFAVWRLWLDREVAPGAAPFRATSGFGPLDNVSVLEGLEHGAAAWSARHRGSVVELHAYAVDAASDQAALRRTLWRELLVLHPELAGAQVVHDEWLWRDDCPLVGTEPWAGRPGVVTPDPRVVLAGDGVRCELPVALMERAATTGFQAADQLLARWDLAGHGVWTVPMRHRHRVVPLLRRLVG